MTYEEEKLFRGLHPMMGKRLQSVAPEELSALSGCRRWKMSTSSMPSPTTTRKMSGCSRVRKCAI